MEFTETVTLEIPNLEGQLSAFLESDDGDHKGLIIEVAAIHEGLTANYNHYSKEALEEALESWVHPYPKPIIMNHDITCDPIGRVMAAKMDKESDGSLYTRLQVAITDPAAMEKVLDGRYLTGSVGGKASEANCSVCEADWSKASPMNIPCRHIRGRTYKGKLAFINMKQVGFKEYSIVNTPADQKSGIRSVGAGVAAEAEVDEDGWVRPARIFSLNMDKEEIFEYTESEARNVLSGMKKKESSPIYLGLKGAFLSALAVEETEKNEETVVEEVDEDNVLSISEELSADLAKKDDEEEEVTPHSHRHEHADGAHDHVHTHDGEGEIEDHSNSEFVPHEHTHGDDAPVLEESDSQSEDEVTEDEVTEESEKRPESQEKPHGADIDPETSKGAPKSREADGEEEDEEDATVAETELDPRVVEYRKAVGIQPLDKVELLYLEAEAKIQTLLEENGKLKGALKHSLAERVVDTKITLGLTDRKDRETDLEEHAKRSASSLADSLRDLSTMPMKRPDYLKDFPTVESTSVAVPDKTEGERVITLVEEAEEKVEKKNTPEDTLVDVLMGRRKLF